MDINEKVTDNFDFYSVKSLFHLRLEDRILIASLMKKCYKDGFTNGVLLCETAAAELTQNKNV